MVFFFFSFPPSIETKFLLTHVNGVRILQQTKPVKLTSIHMRMLLSIYEFLLNTKGSVSIDYKSIDAIEGMFYILTLSNSKLLLSLE